MADKSKHTINYAKVAEEAQLDGFYGVYTNLESTIEEIIAINRRRWEIEETFRILKSEMWTRPVYLEGRKNPDWYRNHHQKEDERNFKTNQKEY